MISVVIAVVVILFLYQPVKVEGTSMMPSLEDQERIFINTYIYRFGMGSVARGDMVAQAAHIPVHLGAMPEAVRAVRGLEPWAPGDVAIVNDPYLGGTHLPDIALVVPVFWDGAVVAFVSNRAHHADVGGMAAKAGGLVRP